MIIFLLLGKVTKSAGVQILKKLRKYTHYHSLDRSSELL